MTLLFADAAREPIVRGAMTLARAVGCTLGPGGRIVLIEDRFGRPIATRDGVTVARSIHLADQAEQLGCRLLADAALKVADEAGDGTTTCVVIAAQLLGECHGLVRAGHAPVQLADEIQRAFRGAEAALMEHSTPLGNAGWIERVASVACKADRRVVEPVCAAYGHVGTSGVILLHEGDAPTCHVELRSGFRIDRGFANPALIPETGRLELGETLVLITNRTIYRGEDLIPCMRWAAANGHALLVVCDTISGTALATLAGNVKAGHLRAAVVKAPGFEDRQWNFLHDLAVWCGGTVQDLSTSLSPEFDPQMLGLVGRLEQDRGRTLLSLPLLGRQSDLDSRVCALELLRDTTNSQYDRDKAVERLGRLRGKIAEIRAGAPTPAEARELKDRIEDAINAVRVAYREGVQPGGGTALWRAAPKGGGLSSPGARALRGAMLAPTRKLLLNAGVRDFSPLRAAMDDPRWQVGVDAGCQVRDMLESFPDPTAVVRSALRAAVSTVVTLLTAETAILLEET